MSVATGGHPPLASRTPKWLLGMFIVSTLLALAWGATWTLGLILADYTSHPAENLTINFFVWEGSLAWLSLQALALVGLWMRRHWGRPVATIASAFWIFSGIGIVFFALAWWGLHRQWDPGVESTFTRDHPSAPAYVVVLTGVGTALVLPWLGFLFIYLPNLIQQLNPGANLNLYPFFAMAFLFSLPVWVVQGLALAGLLQKHDWGAVLAMVTCFLWVLSGVGLPFGVVGLFVLWRWQHPALKPMAAGAPA